MIRLALAFALLLSCDVSGSVIDPLEGDYSFEVTLDGKRIRACDEGGYFEGALTVRKDGPDGVRGELTVCGRTYGLRLGERVGDWIGFSIRRGAGELVFEALNTPGVLHGSVMVPDLGVCSFHAERPGVRHGKTNGLDP